MNRKLLNGLLVVAVAAGGVGTFTSCKDENYVNDVELQQKSLQAQIDAIRGVTDKQFKANMETWLDGLTSTYSDYGFDSYEEAVGALTNLNNIYNSILGTDPLSEEAKDYVDALYRWLFENNLSASDWYGYIFELAERASSVEVNQTFNPMFGSINLPIGLKTNVLASYVVKTTNQNEQFPYNANLNLSKDSPYIPAADDPIINVIQTLTKESSVLVKDGAFTYTEGEEYGNMGAVYATINPASVNFSDNTKYAVTLVNSQGEELGGTTVGIEVNEDLLSFGVTRAEEATGIYKLSVDADSDYAGVMIDLKEDAVDFATDVKNFVKNRSLSNLAYIGEELYNKLNRELPAYGVKVSWTESSDFKDGEAQGEIVNSVISNLDVAAAAVHPLSYGLDIAYGLGESGLSDRQLPVWNSLDEILDKIAHKLSFNYSEIEGLGEVNIDLNVELVRESGDAGAVYYIVFTYIAENGEHITMQLPYYLNNITTDEDNAQLNNFVKAIVEAMNLEINGALNYQIIDDLNASIAEINEQLATFNAKVEDFTEYVKKHKAYKYANKLYDVYAKVAEKFNEIIKNPNHYLQVAAIYSDGEGNYHHLSYDPTPGAETPVEPKDANDAIELMVGSYTGDIVVPSYLKYVAITQVDGVAATAADNEKAGEYVNVVFPGQDHRVPVKVGQFKGHRLTLTYVSVDYSGVCSMQNYYIYVK